MSEHTKGKVTVKGTRITTTLDDGFEAILVECGNSYAIPSKECAANAARLALLWNHFADLTDAEIAAIEVRRTRWFTWFDAEDMGPTVCWTTGMGADVVYFTDGTCDESERNSDAEIDEFLREKHWREIDEPTARAMIDAAKAKAKG